MLDNFVTKFLAFKAWSNKYLWVVSILLLIASIVLGIQKLPMSSEIIIISISMLILLLLVNSIWFVPSQFVGIKRVLGVQAEKSFMPGIYLVIPFITTTILVQSNVIDRSLVENKASKDGLMGKFDVTYSWEIDPQYAHYLILMFGENYFRTKLGKWLDEAIDRYFATFIMDEHIALKGKIAEDAPKIIQSMIDERCEEHTKDKGWGARTTTRYRLVTKYEERPDPSDPTRTILLPRMIELNVPDKSNPTMYRKCLIEEKELEEYTTYVDGINFFKLVSVTINNNEPNAKIQAAYENVSIARIAAEEEAFKSQQKKIAAQAEKDVRILRAEAVAEYKRLIGESENEVREALGRIFQTYPELVKETLAKNFPKIIGANVLGNIDLDKMLGSDGTTPSPTGGTSGSTTTTI